MGDVSSHDYPSLAQLMAFLNARVRALERIEIAHPPSAQTPRKTALITSTQPRAAISKTAAFAQSSTAHCCEGQHYIVAPLLGTALAHVKAFLTTYKLRLLIDSGSELSFISEQLVRQLSIPRQQSSLIIHGIGGSRSTQTLGVVQIQLDSLTSQDTVRIDAHILRTVASITPSSKVSTQEWPHLKKLRLANPEYHHPRQVDIIIGADFYGSVVKPDIIKCDPSMPIAQLSIFSWIILGPINACHSNTRLVHQVSAQQEDDIKELLTKFWIQEELPTDNHPQISSEEEECETHFRTTHSRDSSGRYIVRIPLRTSATALGSSHQTASKCLQKTLRQLNRDEDYRQLYRSFMKEYEELDYMRRVSGDDHAPEILAQISGSIMRNASASGELRVLGGSSSKRSSPQFPYYLPHHGVLKADSSTTKFQVVFNGSSPTTSGTLNDIMHTGQNLLLNIIVLIWIHHHRHVFATDITKMYRQVKVHPEDWNLQRILWIDDQLNEVSFQLTTVSYGTKAAPFLATRVLLQLVEDEGHSFPLAVPSFTHGRYVDDIFGGADTTDQLIDVT